jgi:hypothetical protein
VFGFELATPGLSPVGRSSVGRGPRSRQTLAVATSARARANPPAGGQKTARIETQTSILEKIVFAFIVGEPVSVLPFATIALRARTSSPKRTGCSRALSRPQSRAIMKQRTFFSLLVTVVLVLFALGAAGAYAIVTTGPLALLGGDRALNPTAAMLVPKQAPVMTSFSVNPDRLAGLGQLWVRPQDRREIAAELDAIKAGLLADTDLDYERDIQPWLGDEIAVAVTSLDIDRDRQNGRIPGYLVAVRTRDPERSRSFLERFWANRAVSGADVAFEQYKGVKLIYPRDLTAKTDRSALSGPWASAAIGDRFVLFANHPKVLRDAVNNVQAPDLSLSRSPAYRDALDRVTSGAIGVSFVNLEEFAAWIGNFPEGSLAARDRSPLETSIPPSLTVVLDFNRAGLRAQTFWNLRSAGNPLASLPPLSTPVAALNYVPSNAAVALSGRDLSRLWAVVDAQIGANDWIAQLLDRPLAAARSQLGIDLSQTIFNWVDGEYALALVPSLRENAKGGELDWIFVAERTDEEAVRDALDRLDQIARDRGFGVGPLDVGERAIVAWTKLVTRAGETVRLEARVEGARATVGNYEIFAGSIAAVDTALKAPQNGSLLADRRFSRAIAQLASPNYGYFYLDWLASQAFLERQTPALKLVELAIRPLFDHLRSLASSAPARPDTPGDSAPETPPRADFFVRLGA